MHIYRTALVALPPMPTHPLAATPFRCSFYHAHHVNTANA